MNSEYIKIESKPWHNDIESRSPISGLFRDEYRSDLQEKVGLFVEGIRPLWEAVVQCSVQEVGHSIQASYAAIYGGVEESYPLEPVRLKAIGYSYVLLGSSMGSAFILKALSEKGYSGLDYFNHTKSLTPEFIRLKKLIDSSVQENELPQLLGFVEEAYKLIRF